MIFGLLLANSVTLLETVPSWVPQGARQEIIWVYN